MRESARGALAKGAAGVASRLKESELFRLVCHICPLPRLLLVDPPEDFADLPRCGGEALAQGQRAETEQHGECEARGSVLRLSLGAIVARTLPPLSEEPFIFPRPRSTSSSLRSSPSSDFRNFFSCLISNCSSFRSCEQLSGFNWGGRWQEWPSTAALFYLQAAPSRRTRSSWRAPPPHCLDLQRAAYCGERTS